MEQMDNKELSKPIRVALNFNREIEDIQRIRSAKGVTNPRDTTTNSIRRITEAISKHPSWMLIRKDIIEK